MIVRHVMESELPNLLTLIRAKAEFDGCPETLRATEASLHQALFSGAPRAFALVAESNGELVGMATYYAIFSSFIAKPGLWLDDLFVVETHRSQGIGEALIRRLCTIARESGCGRLDWHVSAFNERGQRFYRRLGASISEKARLVRLDETQIRMLSAPTGRETPSHC